MKFIELMDLIQKKQDIEAVPLACCECNENGYSLLRVQMKGDICYCHKRGVWLLSPDHDRACKSLLKLAKKENYDLVLFPEYCISYTLLKEIVSDIKCWPSSHKLWVLPCQGIPNDEFEEFLDWCEAQPEICLIDNAWNWKVNKKQFVTALFYCFLVEDTRENHPRLCLVPQLKTHPMGDGTCLCEQPGMTTGNMLYILNGRLITLLCADSLNNQITWQDFQEQRITEGLLLLHPQMNAHPQNLTFRRLLNEMETHNQSGIYITCNWAEGTNIYPSSDSSNKRLMIEESWSCIYRKHQDDVSGRWEKNNSLWERNLKYDLIGTMKKKEHQEIWFSDFHMHALAVNIPNVRAHVHGNTQLQNILAAGHYVYKGDSGAWESETNLSCTMQEQVLQADGWETALKLYNGQLTDKTSLGAGTHRQIHQRLMDELKEHCRQQIDVAKSSFLPLAEFDPRLYPAIKNAAAEKEWSGTENYAALMKCLKEGPMTGMEQDLLLIGEGGIGKTVAMLNACQTLLEEGEIALYIPMRRLKKETDTIQGYIERDIFHNVSDLFYCLRTAKGTAKIYLFLDGLNELNSAIKVLVWQTLSEVPFSQLIVASRRPPEAERLYGRSFYRIDMMRLSWKAVTDYLESYRISIPDQHIMSEILGIPLMLKVYIAVLQQKQAIPPEIDACMCWRDEMTSGNNILWNYIECLIYKASQQPSSDTLADYIFAGEYMAPWLAARMNGAGVYVADVDKVREWLSEGLGQIEPSHLERLTRLERFDERCKIAQMKEKLNEDTVLRLLTKNLHLLYEEREKGKDTVSFEHQEFQDTFHLIYLENSISDPKEPFYRDAYTKYKLPYDVITLMSQTFSTETVQSLWTQFTEQSENGSYGIYNLLELEKRVNKGNLSKMDLSGLDLRGVNLQNQQFSDTEGHRTVFRKTKIGTGTFSSQGHLAAVTSVAWSPDGCKIVSGSYDNTLKIWNVETGEYIETLSGHTHYVRSVSWSPDGNLIASGSDDRVLRIWNPNDRSHIPLTGHEGWIYCVSWSADGTRLLSGDSLGNLILWEKKGEEWQRSCHELLGQVKRVTAIAWSPLAPVLVAVGSKDGELRLCDVQKRRIKYVLWTGCMVTSLAWSPDGQTLAVLIRDTIFILDVRQWEEFPDITAKVETASWCVAKLRVADTAASCLAWTGDILAVAERGKIFLWATDEILKRNVNEDTLTWNESSRNCLSVLEDHTGSVTCLAAHPREQKFVSGGDDCTLRIWHTRSPAWKINWSCIRYFAGEQLPVRCSAWSPDGTQLAAGYDDKLIRIWDVTQERCCKILHGHENRIKCLAWSKDGTVLASGSNDKTVCLWDVAAGVCIDTMKWHSGAVNCVLWKDECLISGSDDGRILLWNPKLQSIREIGRHDDSVYCIALSTDGEKLVSGSDDRRLKTWPLRPKNGMPVPRPLLSWVAHEKPLRCVAWIPNSNEIISGSNDFLLKCWDARTGVPWDKKAEMSGHTDFVYACACSPDGRYLASASTDTTIRIWDVERGECLRELREHTGFVWNVSWSSAGGKLFLSSTSSDGRVYIWEISDSSKLQSTSFDIRFCHAFAACSGIDFVDCDFSDAEFEDEKLEHMIHMNGGRLTL